jgi:hypothetical protein
MFPEFRKRKTELRGQQQLSFICCKGKKEMANFCLFAANGNGNGRLFSLV